MSTTVASAGRYYIIKGGSIPRTTLEIPMPTGAREPAPASTPTTGRAHNESVGSMSSPAAPGTPVIGADLVVCNQSAFLRTAFDLAPEAIDAYLAAITERGDALLRGLRGPDALIRASDQLAEAAHTIVGIAGMFGFERLTTVGRRFERAVQAGAADAPALADGLSAALEATLQAIRNRTARQAALIPTREPHGSGLPIGNV